MREHVLGTVKIFTVVVFGENVPGPEGASENLPMSTALVLADAGKRENGRWAHKSLEMSAGGHLAGWRQQLAEVERIEAEARDVLTRLSPQRVPRRYSVCGARGVLPQGVS